MFTPRRAPLKEGRSYPGGLPYVNSVPTGRSRLSQRQAALMIVCLLCIPLLYYFSHTTGPNLPSPGGVNWKTTSKIPPDYKQDDGVMKVDVDDVKSPYNKAAPIVKDESPAPKVEKPDAKPAAKATPPKEDDDDDDEPRKPKAPVKSESTKKHKQSADAERWAERANFEKALTRIIDMLPDEVHMRELTRNVDSTGKERLREMGLRTRAYKKYFEAWEALHLTENDEGSVYIRDDVVQYLRSHQHIGGSGGGGVSDDGGLNGLSLAQTIRAYESYRTFMLQLAELLFPWTAPYFSDHMSLHAHFKKGGRGIVLTAGDDQAPYLLATIPTFRKLGCDLPIEIMYLGDQDLGEDYRTDLEALDGVITRDVAQMVRDEGWKLAGWAAKPFAILLSSFREVIFIDADSLFFRNPASLFEEKAYKETGALFFKDRLIMPESKKRWLQQILPKPIPKLAKESRFWTGTSGHMQESGVVVVDKWQHFIPLLLVTRMNGPDRDGKKEKGIVGVYDMVYGDKETFWTGWLLAGDEQYAFHDGDAGIMGVLKEPEAKEEKKDEEHSAEHSESDQVVLDPASDGSPDNYTICAPQLLHLDLQGRPLWFNGWLLDNKFADRSKKKFANFDNYLVEPRDPREPGAWQLAESNMCCLTTDKDKMFAFTSDEKDVLQMIMKQAQDAGAYGNQ